MIDKKKEKEVDLSGLDFDNVPEEAVEQRKKEVKEKDVGPIKENDVDIKEFFERYGSHSSKNEKFNHKRDIKKHKEKQSKIKSFDHLRSIDKIKDFKKDNQLASENVDIESFNPIDAWEEMWILLTMADKDLRSTLRKKHIKTGRRTRNTLKLCKKILDLVIKKTLYLEKKNRAAKEEEFQKKLDSKEYLEHQKKRNRSSTAFRKENAKKNRRG